jgi:hypothetical protein
MCGDRRFAHDVTACLREKIALAQNQFKNQDKHGSAIADGVVNIPPHSNRVLSR